MIIQENNRTRIEIIKFKKKNAVRKTFKKIKPDRFKQIIKIMLKNPIAPQLLDVGESYYVMPYYQHALNEYNNMCDREVEKHDICNQLITGIFHLWCDGYIHNDIHANNIFITTDNKVVLGDWEHVEKRKLGTPFWENPDLIGGDNTHAFWDKNGIVDLNVVFGVFSTSILNYVYELLRIKLENAGGAYWERISKGQIYGSIDVPGFKIKGRRDPKARLDQFGVDFINKTVLDIGCNAGSISFEAYNRGAAHITGIELLADRVAAAKNIAAFAGIDNKVVFCQHNFDETPIPNTPYDIVCAFAIDHQTQSPASFYKKLFDATKETLLFESSKQPEFRSWCKNELEKAGFKHVKYIGESSASDKKHRTRMCYIAKK